jgi:hypothetical protein
VDQGLAEGMRLEAAKSVGDVLAGAVGRLQALPQEAAPIGKLRLIVECAQRLLQVRQGGDAMGADDLVPLLMWCVVRANVPGLVSEMRYMESLMGEEGSLAAGESGYFFVTMSAVVEYLLSVGAEQLGMGVSDF